MSPKVVINQHQFFFFKNYQKQVIENAKAVAYGLMNLGYCVVTGGADYHVVHLDLKKNPGAQNGAKGDLILEAVGISYNKNTAPGDKLLTLLVSGSALLPSPPGVSTPPT